MEQNEKKGKFEKALDYVCTPKFLIIISLVIITISLLAPLIFTRHHVFESIIFDKNSAYVGDTFGIMNPIIAIAAALITFAAFWTQYQANNALLKKNDAQKEESSNLNRKQQLINQFYEMLKIHQDNVKELEYYKFVTPPEKNETNDTDNTENEPELVIERGRSIFERYLFEFNIAYYLTEILFSQKSKREKTKIAYNAFYKGSSEGLLNELVQIIRKNISSCKNDNEFKKDIKEFIISKKMCAYNEFTSDILDRIFQKKALFHNHSFLTGHFGKLNHYYRHLFLTVKTIIKEDEKILSYREKRDLLRILRAQLSNKEQIMLFYNWFSGHGKQWEEFGDEGNHFFTRFRMIHNMTPYDVIPFQNKTWDTDKAIIDFIQYFSGQAKTAENFENHPVFNLKYAEKEYPEKKNDPLFEFEDWYDSDDHKFKYEN